MRAVSTDIVLVHDAARPFVEGKFVEELLNVLDGADGVIPVVPVGETLKELDGIDVVRTLDRTRHWLAQTPQLFRTESLRRAHEKARADEFAGTDDAQLIEMSGGTVRTVPGSRRNIKVTYPEDFELAQRMLDS